MVIHVEKEDNPKDFVEEIYEFKYDPKFGFDVSDIDIINRKLDTYILQLGRL